MSTSRASYPSRLKQHATGEGCVPAETKMRMLYKSPDYNGPLPDFTNDEPQETIFAQGGASIARLDHDTVAKFGTRVTSVEAEGLLFVQETAPSIPVPRMHACYTIGPIDRDLDDFGSLYDTYIIMAFVEGQTLEGAWDDLSEDCRISLASQMKTYIKELRSIPRDVDFAIGSPGMGPVNDPILERSANRGPFKSEADFNEALVSAYEENMPRAHLRHILGGALSERRHEVVFTHGDLRTCNIMVSEGKITGILDWEMSGWYPAHWEYVKCFGVWGWPKDWPHFVSQVMQPYFNEWVVYDLVKRHMW